MILNKIAAATKKRIERKKAEAPLEKVKQAALSMGSLTGLPFAAALNKPELSFICEVKKASPSRGVLVDEFPYLWIAREYELAGADAISVLTEPDYFRGSDDYLAQIKEVVSLPLLRKDFVVDAYQLYETKIMGASAILLICALLDTQTIRDYLAICDELGLSALVEVHDEREIEAALTAQAKIIGVNNRNLKDLTVDIGNSIRLRKLVPENILYIAESGIKTASDIVMLRQAKVDGVLIGETLMCSFNKQAALAQLRDAAVRQL
ncbi:MAG TPA: indole-3-glycerol phosphate synthase TrpC [Peptococcaceae bacterium]|nr:indole-3-glycerol phosphate synthase TrpC [Peptococcaceae bacterium]